MAKEWKPREWVKNPEGRYVDRNTGEIRKDFSAAEKAAYNMGKGSAFSKTEAGRQKMVEAKFGRDKSLMEAYEKGRKVGMADKKAYCVRQRKAGKK